MGSLAETCANEFGPTTPNLVIFELNRLENTLKDKERDLVASLNEIRALKTSEFLKDKAVVELSNELMKFEEKLENAEKQIEDKNLEIKKLIDEKKAALSSQFAAEAALRRVHANQKEDDSVSVGTLIAPLEAEIRMYKNEVSALQEDRKALDRLMKTKEIALLEVEKSLNNALEKALMVENLQNHNVELRRQVEICLEENKLLEKTNRQKVAEVEKLSMTIGELEECILAGGEAANAVRDYQRQIAELNDGKKTLERELAKAKVCANRVATVVANEWKDEGDRVMPVKQWLEERKFMQSEIQRLKDKLAISERSTKAEAQLKNKLNMRLKTLEDGFKPATIASNDQTANCNQNITNFAPSTVQQKRSVSQPRGSLAAASKLSRSADSAKTLQGPNSPRGRFISGENNARKNLWASRSKFYDENGKEDIAKKNNIGEHVGVHVPQENYDSEVKKTELENAERQQDLHEGTASALPYDRLQKEVLLLRKLQDEKEEALNAKENHIKSLQRKVEALTKAMEMEAKNMKKVFIIREKEALHKSEDSKQKNRTSATAKRVCDTELPSDIIIKIGEISFRLHKFPLLNRSGLLKKLIGEYEYDDENGDECHLQLNDLPGGAKAFELVAKFCYDVKFELNSYNAAALRCAAEHLGMTEDCFGGNLISYTENFLEEIFGSWKDSMQVLRTCEHLLPLAEDLHIVARCINSMETKASDGNSLWNGISEVESDWWCEESVTLGLPLYKTLILSMESRGMKPENIAGSLMLYTKKHFRGMSRNSSFRDGALPLGESELRVLLEEIVGLLPAVKGTNWTAFLLRLLRTAVILHASPACREKLEKRIGTQLEEASVEDLLIPNLGYSAETLYDVDCVQRMLDHFMSAISCVPSDEAQLMPTVPSLTLVTMAAKLVDGYLAEIASDVNLKAPKFQALAALIPDYARTLNDGLYRAIDIFLKAHPWLTDSEREQLCRLMNCQKLSVDASTHAAMNERLPLRVAVQVLFFEQVRLRTSVAGWFFVSGNMENIEGEGNGCLILPMNGAERIILEDEIAEEGEQEEEDEAGNEVGRRVAELERQCVSMKQQIERLGKSRSSWTVFCKRFTKISFWSARS